jgi:colanic acid/amylovoran biosynthesis protein
VRLLLENSGYHLQNLGDVAMLQAACHEILRIRPEAQLRVFTTEPERLMRLCPGVEPIAPSGQAAWLAAKCFPLPQRILPPRVREYIYEKEKDYKFAKPEKALAAMQGRRDYQTHHAAKVESWLDAIDWADAIVATGGGYFTDAFGGHLEGILHTLRWAQCKQRPTAFFGQGLGPLTEERLRGMAAKELDAARNVSLREGEHGIELGKSLGCDTSGWKVTGDDAFALLSSDQHNSATGDALGINLRVTAYAGVDKINTDALSVSLEATRSELGASWMPLPIDLCLKNGDAPQTMSLLAEGTVSADFQTPDVPHDLVALVSNCRTVITGSYHAAVFALAHGIPVVALAANAYYDSKFKGLAAFFPEGIRIVSHTRPEFAEVLLEAVRIQWHMPDNKRRALVEQSQTITESVKAAYLDFFEKL